MADLHFIRVRQKDSNDVFVDPEADIKSIFQRAVLDTAQTIGLVDADNAEYLAKVFAVMATRLAEDKTKLTEQFKEFSLALNKAPNNLVHTFMENVGWWCLISYMLFSRRDSRLDAKDKKKLTTSSAYLYLSELLSDETKKTVETELKDYLEDVLNNQPQEVQIDAVCQETGERISDIQNLVSNMFTAGKMTWREAAAACDKYFDETQDENLQIAAALAYPTYENATFNVLKTEGEEDERSNDRLNYDSGEHSTEQTDASAPEV